MKRFSDREGRTWEVVPGRGSWGMHVVLFVPAGHDAPVRQAELAVSAMDEALDEIERADTARLQQLLDGSRHRDE
ncbi:MAG: hypothetical protein PVH00_04875 [Gemmatimonadota bacterium]|jgi:hypothetical protein